jgi:hypothetical protein
MSLEVQSFALKIVYQVTTHPSGTLTTKPLRMPIHFKVVIVKTDFNFSVISLLPSVQWVNKIAVEQAFIFKILAHVPYGIRCKNP